MTLLVSVRTGFEIGGGEEMDVRVGFVIGGGETDVVSVTEFGMDLTHQWLAFSLYW